MTTNDYGRAYQAGFKPTVRFLLSKGVPHDCAEETAQAAWTRGWERIDQLRDEDLVKTWVNTIAINMYRRVAQTDSRKQPLLDRIGVPGIDLSAIDLGTVLACCCSSDRDLLLHQLNGLTTSEMAHELGASETAVRIRLMRARRSARSLMDPSRPHRTKEKKVAAKEIWSHNPCAVTKNRPVQQP